MRENLHRGIRPYIRLRNHQGILVLPDRNVYHPVGGDVRDHNHKVVVDSEGDNEEVDTCTDDAGTWDTVVAFRVLVAAFHALVEVGTCDVVVVHLHSQEVVADIGLHLALEGAVVDRADSIHPVAWDSQEVGHDLEEVAVGLHLERAIPGAGNDRRDLEVLLLVVHGVMDDDDDAGEIRVDEVDNLYVARDGEGVGDDGGDGEESGVRVVGVDLHPAFHPAVEDLLHLLLDRHLRPLVGLVDPHRLVHPFSRDEVALLRCSFWVAYFSPAAEF
jgi:hypothetical protein